jgi:hypothetical protein
MYRSNEKTNQEYYFTTTVSENLEKDVFVVEFYTDPPKPSSDDLPFKVTKNFDELIAFFEKLD